MGNILSQCHATRVNVYLYVWNIIGLVGTILFIVVVLYFSYKNKATPEEREQRMQKDQEYILSKIRYYKDVRRQLDSRITNLPVIDTRPIY